MTTGAWIPNPGKGSKPTNRRSGAAWLITRLAWQNLLRRPARTMMLVMSVALAAGAVFASCIVGKGIDASMQRSFARMGADLVVVPQEAMVNITSALLTVQPTGASIEPKLIAEIAKLDGVEAVAPQTIYRVPIMAGMPEHKANLIAFDSARDFTVTPWLDTTLPRSTTTGDLIVGGRRGESIGDEVQPCNVPANIYGKLGRTGVGPFDESFFATYQTVSALTHSPSGTIDAQKNFVPSKVSAVLVRLAFGATPEQVRFAIARMPGVKVITGTRIVTSTRQTTTALLAGMLGFSGLMLMATMILVSLLFSAIISERHREVGLLSAIGARRGDVVSMLLTEAVFTTSLGGLFGILLGSGLLVAFQRSLVYYLETLHVEFAWPQPLEIAVAAIACAVATFFVGLIGAVVPAWRASTKEAYALIQGEGG